MESELEGLQQELETEREQSQKISMVSGKGEWVWLVGLIPFQEDMSELKSEIDKLRGKEQQQKQHIRQLESDQQTSVDQCLRLRQEVDRYRQDMALYDSEKRDLDRKLSERDREVVALREAKLEAQEKKKWVPTQY